MSDRVVRVLALSPIPEEGAGCRFRISHYIPYLQANGFQVTVLPFYTPEFFRLVYQRGHFASKAVIPAAPRRSSCSATSRSPGVNS